MNQIKIVVATLVAVLMLASMGSVADAQTDVDDPTVMTQNLYIGVDLSRILLGESPGAVFQTALASDFPGRATAFAGEVANEQPDLIGLQEVTNIFVVNTQGEVVQNLDYLQVVLGNLQARGLNYEVSSAVVNADVTLPLDLEAGLFARVVDRDVILHNADTTEVSDPIAANFADNFTASVGGFPVEFTRGYTAVDATVGLNTFRFVNTHLEVENAPCATPTGFVICQDSQAAELVSTLASEDLPIVLVGDFNAADGEVAYETIAGDGYLDVWSDGDGFTCCEPELLNNADSELDKRIDIIFYRQAGVTEIDAAARTILSRSASGLWYSDHAGVVATLELGVCDTATPTIEGTDGSETINGTPGDDIIFAYGGNDSINGMGGNDIICGGAGNDRIQAGSGDDIVDTGTGNDIVNANDGDDIVYALVGDNTVTGGSGDDTVFAGAGNDTVWTNDGNDMVHGGDGNNRIGVGNGDDVVTTGSGNDTIYLNDGNDTASSGAGDDKVYGGRDTDTVDGGAGFDVCYGEENSSNCER